MSYKSTFLFADPSFISGAAHLLDFWGTFDTYNHARNRPEADAIALYADWRAVGEGLVLAMNQAVAGQSGKTL